MRPLRFGRSLYAVLASTLAALALLVAGCGSSSSDSSADAGGDGYDTVKPIVLQGVQLIPLQVMREKGIADRYRLKLEPQMTAGPEAVNTQMQAPGFEVAFNAWSKAVQLAAAGTKVTSVYPMLRYNNQILVPKDSPVRSIADLKGKKIGMFGGPGGGTTLLFRMLAKRYYGFDPQTDSKLFYGAPGLLAGQLDKGQIDAALLLDPIVESALATGTVRALTPDIGTDWKDRTGQTPLLVAMQMSREWAGKNPDVARRFVAAFADSLQYMQDHPEVWGEFASTVGLRDRASVDLLRESAGPAIVNEWSRDLIDQQFAFGRSLVEAFGNSKDFPSVVPPDSFTQEYAPQSRTGGGSSSGTATTPSQ
jgi:ABC-type nitrate/sulfonate/bicarbonate transport system substrate-binding protein